MLFFLYTKLALKRRGEVAIRGVFLVVLGKKLNETDINSLTGRYCRHVFSPCAGCSLCIFAFVLNRKTGIWKGKVIQKFIVEPPLVFLGTFSRPLRSCISLVYLDVTGPETNLSRIKMMGSLLQIIYFKKKKTKTVITPHADHNCNHTN